MKLVHIIGALIVSLSGFFFLRLCFAQGSMVGPFGFIPFFILQFVAYRIYSERDSVTDNKSTLLSAKVLVLSPFVVWLIVILLSMYPGIPNIEIDSTNFFLFSAIIFFIVESILIKFFLPKRDKVS